MARRTELKVSIEGVDISGEVNKYLSSMTYTDNEEDKADDLQISLDDRENIWLGSWLNTPEQPQPSTTAEGWNIGDTVTVSDKPQYSSYGTGKPGAVLTNYTGSITHLNLRPGVPYPIHVDKKGWFSESRVVVVSRFKSKEIGSGGAKGATIKASIVKKNWLGNGEELELNCGTFEIDSVDVSGPPQKLVLKATSIPYTSTTRTQMKTKAWEKIKLSGIAREIAKTNGLQAMFESGYDPMYERKEQVQESDVVFLQRLCKDAGLALKVTAKTIVLFDVAEYEKKEPVKTIKKGSGDISSYGLQTGMNDTAYSSCRVSYTDPKTKKLIEYTFTPPNANNSGQVLEVNEKVTSREEAKQLAMKRLREKNKDEFKATFSMTGDVLLVAGVTVDLSGFGFFDGKYIIEQATHTVSAGYKTSVSLRKVLEGY